MKSARWILFISLGMGLVSLGVVAFLVMADQGQPAAGSDGGEGGGPIILIMILAVLLIVVFSLRPVWHLFVPRKMKNPMEASAKVLKVWDTGVSVNDNPEVGVLLEVRPPLGAPQGGSFEMEAKTLVSRLNAALVQPGVAAKVRYEADQPKLMEVLSFDLETSQADRAAWRPSSVERLQELADLRARGLVTEEEYARKREEIINDI
ncbi:MAG TPA: SHOCT domain-containing protein [Anaerolineales bacterium]|nr:SHOCT domain-containing protein [Anaerolineales bacterium]